MRLIDADAFKQYCSEGLEEMKSLFKTDKGAELAVKVTESFLKDIDEQPTVNPQTVTEFADKCKECGKIQNEFFNFDAPMVKKSEAVSREAVIDAINFEDEWLFDAKSHNADTKIAFSSLESRVKALPPVTPERPKGKWIKVITNIDEWGETWHFKCSICGEKSNKGYRPLENYCHNCGAEMDGGAE